MLQQKQASSEKKVESKLCLLGRDVVLVQRNALLFGYLKDLNYGNLTNLKRGPMQKLLNKHMVRKRLWEPTDEDIKRRTKRRSSRYSNSVGKQTKNRKLSKANLSVDEIVASKPVDARPMLSKRRKTNIVYVYDDSQPHRLQGRYKGLENKKNQNRCYFNSVIQCL